MAEVAGLALGVFGLAGLIGAFKDTVDLFVLLADTRHLGQQYEILDMKFDIEKMLLLHWADRVRLLDRTYDSRLNNAHTQELVFRILASIRLILTDTNALQQRYGLRPLNSPCVTSLRSDSGPVAPPSELLAAGLPSELLTADLPSEVVTSDQSGQSSNTSQRRWRMSQLRMDRFIHQFEALQLRIDTRKKTTSMGQKVRWVIRDKLKFEDLIRDLSHLISKLNELVPSNNDSVLSPHSMVNKDISVIKEDVGSLKMVLEAAVGHHQVVAESTQKALDEICQRKILNTLWFRKMDDREEDILPNHPTTLQWVLEAPTEVNFGNNFAAWLRHASGIYWISGKAGSGKSTLMKYLRTHESTKAILSQWANSEQLLMCHYFFLNLGTKEQKTQEGLSRTLLYQILKKNPSLTQDALPNMWREIMEEKSSQGGRNLGSAEDISLPSVAETRRAFEVIAGSTGTTGRLCFFIDGLDELMGDYMDGISLIQSLAKNDKIKVIVSSRPIPACVAAFGTLPHLQLQDLTRDDIQAYVEDQIGSHPSMKKHKRRYPNESSELLRILVQRSYGVWLWIILACRSIRSGFDDHDRLSEIRSRVDELPPELEGMFMHMLSKIHKRHQQQGAQLLRICYIYQRTESPFLKSGLFALGLALVDDYHTGSIEIQHLTAEDEAEICDELEGRLRSRCWGLLEFEPVRNTPSARRGRSGLEIDARVRFMHRTVFEFLSNDDVWKLDCLQMQDDLFDAATALSLYGIHMATQFMHAKNDIRAMDHFEEGLWWGVEADKQKPGDPRNCFNHIDPFLDTLPEDGLSAATLKRLYQAKNTHKCSSLAFLLAIEAGAANFVTQHPDFPSMLKRGARSCGCNPILYHALNKRFLSSNFNDMPSQGMFRSSQMVHLLLSSGCKADGDVFTSMGRTTLWSLWQDHLDYLGDYTLCGEEKSMFLSITERFNAARKRRIV